MIVIGAGCAGMIAALEARSAGARVWMIHRAPLGAGTNSALAGGTFSGPTPHYPAEAYIKDTLRTGRWINREGLVRQLAENGEQCFLFLRSLGLSLVEFSHGYALRSRRPETTPGATLVRALSKRVSGDPEINLMTGFYVTDILKHDGSVWGVKGFDKTGKECVVQAPAVVLATGGAGGVYLRNDNQKGIMGRGYHLAATVGAELRDMEFVQFHPLVVAEPRLPSFPLYFPLPEEARLTNERGENVLEKYGIASLNEATKTRRDEISVILYQERLHDALLMDYRKVPEPSWDQYPLTRLKKMRFDFRNRPFAVSPAVHFFMGGVAIGEDGQTSLPGLFACGEVAGGVHGANRMRGNALTECVVFGRIAGIHAARYALEHQAFPSGRKERLQEEPSSPSTSEKGLMKLKRQIQETAWQYAGVVRSERGLMEGMARLRGLEDELKRIRPQAVLEIVLKGDLSSAVFVLRAVLTASLSREESRGAFAREDFPQKDDPRWAKSSCWIYDASGGTFLIRHSP